MSTKITARPTTTRAVVEAYFHAWTSKDTKTAYDLLADDLEFTGPNAHFRSKADFKPGLEGFAALTTSAQVVDLLVDGDRVAMLYDAVLPAPVGAIRIASFFRVEAGLIRTYDTRFDAETFRQLMALLQKKKV